jgi:hypothetical protein
MEEGGGCLRWSERWWWSGGGRVEDTAEGSMSWWCRVTAASMAPVLVHQRHNDTLG